MKKISLPIDASRFDVRVTWAGLKEDDVPADAGVVEGFPIDPPDDRPGWLLVNFGVEVAKDADRYWSLWAREKVKAKKTKKRAATAAKSAVEKTAKPRGRPRKAAQEAPAETPVEESKTN